MKVISLANISYEEALGCLMLRKEALDKGEEPALTKEALDAPLFVKAAAGFLDKAKDIFSSAANTAGNMAGSVAGKATDLAGKAKGQFDKAFEGKEGYRDALLYSLIGAGAGGGLSLAHSAATGDKNWKRKAMRYGVLGGGLGLGANLAVNAPELASKVGDKVAPVDLPKTDASGAAPAAANLSKDDQLDLHRRASGSVPELAAAVTAGGATLPLGAFYAKTRAPGLDHSLLGNKLQGMATQAASQSDPVKALAGMLNQQGGTHQLNMLLGDTADQATNPQGLSRLFKNLPNQPAPDASDGLKPFVDAWKTGGPIKSQVPSGVQAADTEAILKLLNNKNVAGLAGKGGASRLASGLLPAEAAESFAKDIQSPGMFQKGVGGSWKVKPQHKLNGGLALTLAALIAGYGSDAYQRNSAARAEARAKLGLPPNNSAVEKVKSLFTGAAQ